MINIEIGILSHNYKDAVKIMTLLLDVN